MKKRITTIEVEPGQFVSKVNVYRIWDIKPRVFFISNKSIAFKMLNEMANSEVITIEVFYGKKDITVIYCNYK